jgi:hypothetical protein
MWSERHKCTKHLVTPGALSCTLFIVRLRYRCVPMRERVADRHLAANVGAVGITFHGVAR